MEKQILLTQLNDRVLKALSLITCMYPSLKEATLEAEEVKGLIDLIDGLKCIIQVIADIQYNDNMDNYKDIMYSLARGGNDE